MWDIIKEVNEAASVSNVTVRQLPMEFVGEFRKKIFAKYPLLTLAEDVRYSYRDAQAWRWICEFAIGKTLFFFPSDLESNMFEIEHGEEIMGILENSFAFEFFLTDYELTYLLFYDHHDYLGAYGTAIEWLKEKVAEIKKK